MRKFINFMGAAAIRAWVAFCVFAIIGFVICILVYNPDPLRRDDAYCLGFAFGGVAAFLTMVYSVAKGISRLVGRPWIAFVIYLLALILFFLFIMISAYLSWNGTDPSVYYAWAVCGVGLGIGMVSYPFCRFDFPRAVVVFISCFGILFLTMYCLVKSHAFGVFEILP